MKHDIACSPFVLQLKFKLSFFLSESILIGNYFWLQFSERDGILLVDTQELFNVSLIFY